MSLIVKKIKETVTRYDNKEVKNYTYVLEGAFPTWDGDTATINVSITSNQRLELEEDYLLKLTATGVQEKLIFDNPLDDGQNKTLEDGPAKKTSGKARKSKKGTA